MQPDPVEMVGYLAAILTTLAFIPQVVRTWRTRSAEDLSFPMLVAFSLGVFLWLVYGVLLESAPMVAANVVTFALSVFLTILQRRFRKRRPAVPPVADRRSS